MLIQRESKTTEFSIVALKDPNTRRWEKFELSLSQGFSVITINPTSIEKLLKTVNSWAESDGGWGRKPVKKESSKKKSRRKKPLLQKGHKTAKEIQSMNYLDTIEHIRTNN
jgi:hypothetical protein